MHAGDTDPSDIGSDSEDGKPDEATAADSKNGKTKTPPVHKLYAMGKQLVSDQQQTDKRADTMRKKRSTAFRNTAMLMVLRWPFATSKCISTYITESNGQHLQTYRCALDDLQ